MTAPFFVIRTPSSDVRYYPERRHPLALQYLSQRAKSDILHGGRTARRKSALADLSGQWIDLVHGRRPSGTAITPASGIIRFRVQSVR
jgi:hypothetical protein